MLVLPGGVDGHCHLDQPMPDGLRMADDFLTGTRSALCGGTTTVIPFAAQAKGQSLQAAVDDYHRRAEGRALIDYGFHLIVADPTPHVLAEELPRLIANGYTSFKVYMTYDDLKLNDRQMLDVLTVAREHGALVMVHAENSDCIGWLTERLLGQGHACAARACARAARRGRARGDASRDRVRGTRRRADPHRARIGRGCDRADPLGRSRAACRFSRRRARNTCI